MRLAALVMGITLSAALVPAVLPASPAAAATCKPATTLLSRTPVVRNLPGGAVMRIWDTGATSDPMKSQRIVAVKIPATSALRGHVITTGALTTSTTVGKYAARVSSSAVTVNGSVFDAAKGAIPTQLVKVNGVALKGDTHEQGVVAMGADRRAYSEWLHLSGKATGRSWTWPITGLNWGTVTGSGVNVYTSAWGTARRPYGTVDVVVSNGKVVARRTGTSRGYAPTSNQRILTANGTVGTQLSALRVGDAVPLTYGLVSKSGKPVLDAIARGHRYLDTSYVDGGSCSTRDEQLRPRTAVAWTKAGDTLVVTFSGRAVINGVMYGGSTHHQMPIYLRQLGAVVALGLDGGGSTTMFVRSKVGAIPYRVDRLSSTQRMVPNALTWY